MHVRPSSALGALATVMLLGCSGNDEQAEPEPAAARVSFATFNTALGVGLAEYPAERLDRIAEDLPELGADVVCLQEVWQLEQTLALVAALEAHLPYAYYTVAALQGEQQPATAACDASEVALLAGCLQEYCAGLEGSEVELCVVANCVDEFVTVSSGCQDCIVANQTSDPETILAVCGSEGADAAQYEHQNGLLLLSRYPLTSLDHLVLDSSLGDRGVLSARIETDVVPRVEVFCTHLAATLGDVPYAGSYGSWAGERTVQIEQLLAYVSETREAGSSIALLGDLNCGPETEQLPGSDPDNFARFTAAGFEAPYVDSRADQCTWCLQNPMTGGTDAGGQGAIIDHALFFALPRRLVRQAERVFDDPVEIEVNGQAVQTYRSDHFGVQVTASEPD
jgi:endonuclease/exonuclease/phosphatase family metal-dependent hydrolase